MTDSDWAKAVETVRAHTVKVETPAGFGTGFLITYREQTSFYGIATAYHVIQHARDWGIRLTHANSGVSRLLSASERSIVARPEHDVAIVLFSDTTLGLPKNPLPLGPADGYARIAWHIGWLGYPDPALAGGELCFFEGAISCVLQRQYSYLVDGVSIHGVSGGPAFMPFGDKVWLIGVILGYSPNRVTPGETLPGLCFVRGIHPYHDFIATLKSIEDAEAKKQQFESRPFEEM